MAVRDGEKASRIMMYRAAVGRGTEGDEAVWWGRAIRGLGREREKKRIALRAAAQ